MLLLDGGYLVDFFQAVQAGDGTGRDMYIVKDTPQWFRLSLLVNFRVFFQAFLLSYEGLSRYHCDVQIVLSGASCFTRKGKLSSNVWALRSNLPELGVLGDNPKKWKCRNDEWVFLLQKMFFFGVVGPKCHIKELVVAPWELRELWVILWYFEDSLNKLLWILLLKAIPPASLCLKSIEIISVDRLRCGCLKSFPCLRKGTLPFKHLDFRLHSKEDSPGPEPSDGNQPGKSQAMNQKQVCSINISLSIHLLCNLSWDHWDLWFLLEIYDASMFCSLIFDQKLQVFFLLMLASPGWIFFMIWCFFRGPKLKEWRAYTDVVKLGLLCMCRTGVSLDGSNQHGMVVS